MSANETRRPAPVVTVLVVAWFFQAASGAAQPVVRQSIFDLTGEQIATLRVAVEVLQARDPLDPTSWVYQANIHAVPSCTHNGSPLPGCVVDTRDRSTWPERGRVWGSCPHGNLLFLSWHRWYLYYLERLLREAVEDPSFALPYWNYSEPDPDPRRLPVPLRLAGVPNALFARERNEVRCDVRDYRTGIVNLGDPLDPMAVDASKALDEDDWDDFLFEVERLPHNQVHVALGGFFDAAGCNLTCDCSQSRVGWMRTPLTAARDPVFWLHHANIDRLWNRWLDHPDHQNPTPGEIDGILEERLTRPFVEAKCRFFGITDWEECKGAPVFLFVDVGGSLVAKSPRDLILGSLDPAALGSRYDDDPEPIGPEPGFRALAQDAVSLATEAGAEAATGATLGDRVHVFDVATEPEDRARTEQMFRSLPAEEGEAPEVLLVIEGIRLVGEEAPAGFYEIYLNLPEHDEVDLEDADLRERYEDHFVGVLNFFALGAGHDGEHGMGFRADITENVLLLALRNRWRGNELSLTFVPRGPFPDEPAIAFDRVDLVFE